MNLDDRQVAALLTAIGDDALEDDGDGATTATLTSLFDRVRVAALAARPAGRPYADETVTVAPIEQAIGVFRRQVAALDSALDSLPDTAWSTMTDAAWTVHELLAHLVTVEEYLGSVLGLWAYDVPAGTESDHRAMTEVAIAQRTLGAPAQTVAAWRARVRQLFEAVGDGSKLPAMVSFHGLEMSPRNVFVTRAFEVWTHHDDIRRALGRPLTEPPAADVRLMSSLAVRSTPLGLALAGHDHRDRTVRVVLTGDGGGTWVIGYGSNPPAEPDTTFIVDAIEFCRMAAQRLSIDALAIDVDGDRSFADDVCVGAQVFAA
ncbi:MAG: maleylpyruvate isomerase family mycothiol-dependent enzyme [Acidimicrobiales bacterium]